MSNITVTRNQNNSSMSVNNQTTEIAVNRTESLGVTLPWMEKEDKSNKVQTIGPSSTAYQYPSAKAVYDAIEAIPTLEQKQSDWTQTDASEVDYIKNKPSLAMVATSGSYNDLSDKPTIPVVPTDLSDFNNDVGFITASDIPTDLSDFNNDVGYITLTDVPEQVNSDWNSNSGKSQILNKPNLATVATSGSYNDLSDKPVIPAAQVQSDWTQSDSSAPDYIKNKPSMPSAQIQSDWAQTNIAEVDYIKNKPNLATVATSGSYNDLSDQPTIPTVPTDLSAFNNDVGFITASDIPEDLSDFNNDAGFITLSDVPPQEQADWAESDSTKVDYIKNKPTLSAVATSGSYNDLSDKPTIPAAQINSDWDAVSGVAQILNKPTIPVVPTNVSAFTNDVPYATTSQIPNVPIESISVNGTAQTITNKNVDISVPTKTSDLTNDSGFITINDVPAQEQANWSQSDSSAVDFIKNKPSLATVATSGNYNDLSNKPTIPVVPTNVSAFTNDVPYATTSQIPVVRIYSISVNGVDQPVAQGNVDITVPDAQIQSDWSQSDSSAVDYIKNKPNLATVATSGDYGDLLNTPTIPSAQVNSDWDAVSGVAQILNKPSLATVATSGSYNDLSNTPAIPTKVSDLQNDSGFITSWGQADWSQSDNTASDYVKNKPSLASVATSGSYNDLSDKPTIPASPVQSNWNESDTSSLAYIQNKPTIPVVPTNVSSFTNDAGYITSSDIPTNLSDFTNDVGYITLSQVPAQVQSDWNQSDSTSVDFIKNKPTIPVVPTTVSSFTNDAGYITLSDVPAQVQTDWNATTGIASILNKPTLATVATSGSYDDLSDKPSIPAAQVNSDWTSSSGVSQILNKPNLATVATSGSYSDLSNKPTIPVQAQAIASGDTGYVTGDMAYQAIGDIETLLLALRGNV